MDQRVLEMWGVWPCKHKPSHEWPSKVWGSEGKAIQNASDMISRGVGAKRKQAVKNLKEAAAELRQVERHRSEGMQKHGGGDQGQKDQLERIRETRKKLEEMIQDVDSDKKVPKEAKMQANRFSALGDTTADSEEVCVCVSVYAYWELLRVCACLCCAILL